MDLPLSSAGRRYGCRKDGADYRDFGIARLPHSSRVRQEEGRAVIDLEPWCGPVKDQGELGACVYFTACGWLEFLHRKYQGNSVPVFSPLFAYYLGRQMEGTLAEGDVGSTGRTACKVLNRFGVCLESEDPYQPKNFRAVPSILQLAEAAKCKAGAYHRISTVEDMKDCLASHYVFGLGFDVFASFEKIGPDGIMPTPNKKIERLLGRHEVLCIGFDDAKQAFKMRNSWGSTWGASGNFWMPYAVAADRGLDAWIQHLGPAWGTPARTAGASQ